MKPIRATCLGLAMTASFAGLATAQGPLNIREVFQKLDANGDMVIERGEVPPAGLPAFERLLKAADSNKDGKIDASEMRDLAQSMPGGGLGGDPTARFKAMDKDGDGKVSKAEFSGPPTRFDQLDANKDGFIDKGEVPTAAAVAKAAGAGAMAPGTRIMQMDKDGDGKVSKAEFTGQPIVFDRLDADSDGFVTRDEAARGVTAMIERIRAMDADGDGKISRDEFKGPPARFDQIDANKDGFLSFEEMGQAAPGAGGGALKKAAAAKAEAKKKKADN